MCAVEGVEGVELVAEGWVLEGGKNGRRGLEWRDCVYVVLRR